MDELDLKKQASRAFIKQIAGPLGGVFALGIFIGLFVMHVYMSEFVYKSQLDSLQTRIATLEAEKTADRAEINALRTRLENIAFGKIEE